MAKLTLTISKQGANAEDFDCLSVTEHDTLTEALNEFAGWDKQGATHYMVQGTMSVQCACKRILESRNRAIQVFVTMTFNGTDANGDYIDVKAPQAVAYLETVLGGIDNAEVDVLFTNNMLRIG